MSKLLTYFIIGIVGMTVGLVFEVHYIALYVPIVSIIRYSKGSDKTANPIKIAGAGIKTHILILGGIVAAITKSNLTNVEKCPDCASRDVEYDGGIDWKCLECGYEFDELDYRT